MYKLRYRQVHLDFHTSPAIDAIGGKFDKKQFQNALRMGHVDSITCFSKCHHGLTYHDTKVGTRHPLMVGELFRDQYEACKEIDVNIPIYLSAGLDDVIAESHPQWREMNSDGGFAGWGGSPLEAGFKKMCFNSPYIDSLCEQIREAIRMFPESDGVFLDIIAQSECCCMSCMAIMEAEGLDATNPEHRQIVAKMGLDRYYRETTAASRCDNPDMPVFHNSGHIFKGEPDLLPYFSHMELESLPTGGWGYDHFPFSAKYCENLPHDFLGMTGKFHTTWGEFGGYKHPNALRYECAAMLAFGSKCSVGDQLHPSGEADESTYRTIGAAYEEVEAKEPWCIDATSVSDIAVLSSEAVNGRSHTNGPADTGVGRILLEGHFLFTVLDKDMDFSPYRMLLLPDDIIIDDELKAMLDVYLAAGGKLMLTGTSGMKADGSGFAFDIGADWSGESEFNPDYTVAIEGIRPSFVDSPLVMYMKSQRIKVTDGKSLGVVHDPYFNRNYKHYCSHQHAPARAETSGYDCGVINAAGNIMYLAHPVFSIYRAFGAVSYQEYVVNAIRTFLGDPTAEATLPSTARLSLTEQTAESRYVLHLLYANTINRGGAMQLSGGNVASSAGSVEVIEELLPLHDIAVAVRTHKEIKTVTLEPQGTEVEFTVADGKVELKVDEFTCHQMIALHY